jgi:8-oxo-dGTP pyrophosphatase MutT (NUDIX family)
MADFGGPQAYTTWDGEPVSRERPHGAMIVVASQTTLCRWFLLLHRAHRGPDYDGDWGWTPPSGSRKPGEDVTTCARRELQEEVGLVASPSPVIVVDADWAVFVLDLPWPAAITVDGLEHDRFEWVTYADAQRRLRPDVLAASFRAACDAADWR